MNSLFPITSWFKGKDDQEDRCRLIRNQEELSLESSESETATPQLTSLPLRIDSEVFHFIEESGSALETAIKMQDEIRLRAPKLLRGGTVQSQVSQSEPSDSWGIWNKRNTEMKMSSFYSVFESSKEDSEGHLDEFMPVEGDQSDSQEKKVVWFLGGERIQIGDVSAGSTCYKYEECGLKRTKRVFNFQEL